MASMPIFPSKALFFSSLRTCLCVAGALCSSTSASSRILKVVLIDQFHQQLVCRRLLLGRVVHNGSWHIQKLALAPDAKLGIGCYESRPFTGIPNCSHFFQENPPPWSADLSCAGDCLFHGPCQHFFSGFLSRRFPASGSTAHSSIC